MTVSMRIACFTFSPHCAQYPGLSPQSRLSSSLQQHPLEQAVILKLMRLDHVMGFIGLGGPCEVLIVNLKLTTWTFFP